MINKELEILEKKHIWHPCSQMKDYEEFPAINIVKGEGVWLYKDDGKRLLDAVSSWWVNIFGHSNKFIADAISIQAHKLEHVIFADFTHEPAIKLGKSLSALFDDKLPKVFYCDNGSASIEAALKLSYQYRLNTGQKKKNKFAYISKGYHGETIGALAAGGVAIFKETFKPLLMDTVEITGPDCYRCPFGKNRDNCNAECFEVSKKQLSENENITSIIIEPIVQCVAGMRIYSPVYLQKLRKLCNELDIHLIADEIAAGFGRTGTMTACSHAGIIPDIACFSKGLTSGFLPMSALLTTENIYNAFYDDYQSGKAFLHSHSFNGNPITCAAANATFELFKKTNILEVNKEKSKYIADKLLSFKDYKYTGEIRGIGMIHAIELVEDKNTKKIFDHDKRIGYKIYREAEKNGLLLRNIGNIIYFMPPLIIEKDEIDFMIDNALITIKKILG